MVQLINDNGAPSETASLEDCEVRDDDDYNGSFMASNSNRFAKGPLTMALGGSLADEQRREESFRHLSSSHKRRSSGRMAQKLVTNESIKPLPTSFALQKSSPSHNPGSVKQQVTKKRQDRAV